MTILFLLTQDLESPSGLGRYWPLAKNLAARGHRITIAALHPDIESLPERRFHREGVEIRYVAPMHVKKSANVKSYYGTYQLLRVTAQATLALSIAALSIPAEIVHVGKPHPMNSVAGLLAKLVRRHRLFLDVDDYESEQGHFGSLWQKRVLSIFERKMPHRADRITANTRFISGLLISWGIPSNKIAYLSNGVDSSRFQPPEPKRLSSLRERLGIGSHRVVLYIGSLSTPSHPVSLLLEAFVQVAKAIPEARLILVGGGADFEYLQRLSHQLGLTEKVIFTGKVAPEEATHYYHLAEVSVDPVEDDGAARGRSPLKLFESWRCGIPYVSADVGDRQWLLGDPPAGLLTRPGNPGALADALMQVLTDRELAGSLSRRGLERVDAYEWELLTRQLEEEYRAVRSR